MNDKKLKIVVHTRIYPETMDKLEMVANAKKWKISDTIRNILEDYLK